MKLPSPRTEPASERTSPLKAISFSSSVAAAGRVVQGDAAGEIEPVDRQRAQIDRPGRCRPIDAPLRVEPEIERHAVDRQFGGAHLAAHQRAQAEFHVELVGANLAEIVGAADHDRVQLQRRRRQQPRVELAAASSLPPTRTGAPMIRVASASNCGRNWFQSMKYGPMSAATSAMMKAIARPSSVVCTVSPLEPPRRRPRHAEPGARSSPEYREQVWRSHSAILTGAHPAPNTGARAQNCRAGAVTSSPAGASGRAARRSAAIPD